MLNGLALLVFLFALCLLPAPMYADMAPDPGYVRRSASLILETTDDLSDYRFFLESPLRIEEIEVDKSRPIVIAPDERVGAARVVTLWAVPRNNMGEFGANISEKAEQFRDALVAGRVNHAVRLLSHSFQTTIKEAEISSWKPPVYRLGKNTEQGVTALLVSDTPQNKNNANGGNGPVLYSTEPEPASFWVAVAGGMILTALFITFGALALRRTKSRAAERDSLTK